MLCPCTAILERRPGSVLSTYRCLSRHWVPRQPQPLAQPERYRLASCVIASAIAYSICLLAASCHSEEYSRHAQLASFLATVGSGLIVSVGIHLFTSITDTQATGIRLKEPQPPFLFTKSFAACSLGLGAGVRGIRVKQSRRQRHWKRVSKMRYEDWDILLFPRDCKVPFKEFKVACHVVHDSGRHRLISGLIAANWKTGYFRVLTHTWFGRPSNRLLFCTQHDPGLAIQTFHTLMVDTTYQPIHTNV